MVGKRIFCLLMLVGLCGCTYGRVDLGDGKYSQAAAISGQGGVYKVGKPYKISGRWYYPKEDYDYSQVGIASWYGKDFHAKTTANGEKYDMYSLTAAHRTLPLPSIVKVTNLENGRSLVLRVNDRGPYAKNRIIDVSKRASQLLGFQMQGTTKVRVEIMEKESKALKAAMTGEKCDETDIYDVQKQAPVVSSKMLSAADYPEGSYFVQVGSYTRQDGAQKILNQIGEKSNIYYTDVDGQRFYRVRVGPFDNEKEAQVSLAKLRYKGFYDAKVVSE